MIQQPVLFNFLNDKNKVSFIKLATHTHCKQDAALYNLQTLS